MSIDASVSRRVLALDIGGKRTGLAISDASGTLARPLGVITSAMPIPEVIARVEQLQREDDGLGAIVVGRPVRLDGSANEQTPRVETFVAALRARTPLPVVLQDERLTSVEAESRLAVNDKDWRRRKHKLDAAAAAVILQDYLDSRTS
jgi:putative Holliday junction resolvase